ncbi:alpha/beta-hydrolase [Cylindrobasidium torrendii FP15055 ss-10]|uniref:Alpha/beta-hydrolase n=1 Tax=Cylindrobasidium torrendii FP15055 ss-10 TaxID=1314674 RepID=A0A0D7B3N1_9AGAR|nr:alpha/beta-hydrolase [Cylindrobasidium torrendii FP15055 ss-10]
MSGFIPSAESFAKGVLATASTAITIGAGLVYYGQNYLIYPSAYFSLGPEADIIHRPQADYGLPSEELELKTPDGVLLRCYLLYQQKDLPRPKRMASIPLTPIPTSPNETDDEFMAGRPTVIMFHGNAGNLGHRLPLGMIFSRTMRCNVLMVSYRGYGKSEGSPSEKGFQIDAQTALNFLLSDPRFSRTQIFLYGQSIGGAVAIDLASQNPTKIAALILENTFTSLPNLVPDVLPMLGRVSFLCHQKWDSASKAPKLPAKMPVLLLSGKDDLLIPPLHMQRLRDHFHARGEDNVTYFEEFPGGGHNDTCNAKDYWSKVAHFVGSVVHSVPYDTTTPIAP